MSHPRDSGRESALCPAPLALDEPIMPGTAAGGIRLGSRVMDLPAALLARFSARSLVNACIQAPTGTVCYHSTCVDVWATDGLVDQVMVHGGYRGTLSGGIRLGMPLAAVERTLGPVVVSDADSIAIAGLDGVALAVAAGDISGDIAGAPMQAPIVAIYVFAPAAG